MDYLRRIPTFTTGVASQIADCPLNRRLPGSSFGENEGSYMLTCLHSPLHLTTSIYAFLEEIYAKRERVVDVRSLSAVQMMRYVFLLSLYLVWLHASLDIEGPKSQLPSTSAEDSRLPHFVFHQYPRKRLWGDGLDNKSGLSHCIASTNKVAWPGRPRSCFLFA
ncbi:hypothetical protein FRC18_005280 [Serendipita sp. 400]|nr:hypothetical protein FRC18_005280 [Serendipita sp. 400]